MTHSTQALFNLSGKTALVTGATCNLGLTVARALGGAGARLMLCADEPDALERAAADLQSAGMDARWVAADMAQAAGRERLVSEILHRMGDVDILLNYASHSALEHNLRAYLELSQQVMQHSMLARRQGRIIHIVPTVGPGLDPSPWSALLHQTAHSAVAHLARAQAAQWASHFITVNAIGLAVGRDELDARNEQHVPIGLDEYDGFDSLQGACLLFASEAGRSLSGQYLTVRTAQHPTFHVG